MAVAKVVEKVVLLEQKKVARMVAWKVDGLDDSMVEMMAAHSVW